VEKQRELGNELIARYRRTNLVAWINVSIGIFFVPIGMITGFVAIFNKKDNFKAAIIAILLLGFGSLCLAAGVLVGRLAFNYSRMAGKEG
jgi:hypothetical protein